MIMLLLLCSQRLFLCSLNWFEAISMYFLDTLIPAVSKGLDGGQYGCSAFFKNPEVVLVPLVYTDVYNLFSSLVHYKLPFQRVAPLFA